MKSFPVTFSFPFSPFMSFLLFCSSFLALTFCVVSSSGFLVVYQTTSAEKQKYPFSTSITTLLRPTSLFFFLLVTIYIRVQKIVPSPPAVFCFLWFDGCFFAFIFFPHLFPIIYVRLFSLWLYLCFSLFIFSVTVSIYTPERWEYIKDIHCIHK
jgi:hypothetical protein